MSQIERFQLDVGGKNYTIYVESKTTPEMQALEGEAKQPVSESEVAEGERESYGLIQDIQRRKQEAQKKMEQEAQKKMEEAKQMIRGYAAYALSAFKDFETADIEEVTLKFGLKLGTRVSVPYITEGSAESNLAIEVKCKFPDTQQLKAVDKTEARK